MARNLSILCLLVLLLAGCAVDAPEGDSIGIAPSQSLAVQVDALADYNLDALETVAHQRSTLGMVGSLLDSIPTTPEINDLALMNMDAIRDNEAIKESLIKSQVTLEATKPQIQQSAKNEKALIKTREEVRHLRESNVKEWIDMLMWIGMVLLGLAGLLLGLQACGVPGSFAKPMVILALLGGLSLALALTLAWFGYALALVGAVAVGIALVVVLAYLVWRVIGLIRDNTVNKQAVADNVELVKKLREDVAGLDGGAELIEKWFSGETPLAHAIQHLPTIDTVRKVLGK